ncbi:MAG: MiaB/RimO family radical SAM methylthiotransferase [Candidatus Omnitrophica bacterium]|nr:MiaB/RimO family radical SAM methylthiotransferase [Candidatus Omnitrophota bacterium]MCF7887774.1 MiaB/RimO family radical SAM methylthiotransferase [Candidatus Omnitrophota bacterium]
MNDRDSEALLGLFLRAGYKQAESEEDADVILVNTCSVRDHAENRALSLLGTYKKLKQSKVQSPKSKVNNYNNENSMDDGLSTMDYPQRRKPIVGLIGCMAKNKGDEVFSKMPHIDLICGPAAFFKIPEYIERIKDKGSRIKDLEDKVRDESFYGAAFRQEIDHAQVVISTGCSNFCSYCIVPYTRGKLRPRSFDKIISEIKNNIKQGRRKITLLGQNVNDYNFEPQVTSHKSQVINFVELLRKIYKIEGLEELDFVTSHPKNTSKELFELMAESDKIKKHLHLPFQSGSNRILKLMGRGYTREKYAELINQYKQITAGTLGTDIIIGFPSESEEDFKQTKSLVKEVGFKYAFIFKYSPRLKTKAAEMADDVPEKVKSRRHKELLDLQKNISRTL